MSSEIVQHRPSASDALQIVQHNHSASDTSEDHACERFGWRSVWALQKPATATLLFTIGPIIGLIVASTVMQPAQRPWLVYDATISYQQNASTIPFTVAWLVAALALLLTTILVETLRLRPRIKSNLPVAAAIILHFMLDAIQAFLVTCFLTELTKNLVGELRPDFLSRCQPTDLSITNAAYGNSISQQQSQACAGNPDDVTGGRRSFPSGHSSGTAVWCAYCVMYLHWAVFQRWLDDRSRDRSCAGGEHRAARDAPGFVVCLGHALVLYWMLLVASWAFGVGISRMIDNKHSAADVVGGWLLGIVVGAIFCNRAICLVPPVPGKGTA